ncbi:MAG: hypothetical protein J6N70_09290 [Oribacterium sp.]|nr:hypothetical protein [Oribacterium sp.]
MIDFMTIKNSVSVPDAAEYYGIEDRHGMCRCIFHEEDTPSMKLYQNNYHCFGCGAHGDVIDLVQQIFSISPAEAAKRLNSDFNLGLDMDKPADSRKIELLKQRRREHDKFIEWDKKHLSPWSHTSNCFAGGVRSMHLRMRKLQYITFLQKACRR